MSAPTLYTTTRSANGRKPLALVAELGLDVRVESVDVYRGEGQRPEHLARHALGKIPVLVDGDLVLGESNALLMYLSERHGDFRLFSRSPEVRADIVRWMFWEASQWQPALVPVLAGCVAQKLGLLPATPPQEASWSDAGFVRQARFLDEHLRDRSFLVGDAPTIADLSVAGMMTYARAAKFPFDDHRGIADWYARVETMKGWRESEDATWRT